MVASGVFGGITALHHSSTIGRFRDGKNPHHQGVSSKTIIYIGIEVSNSDGWEKDKDSQTGLSQVLHTYVTLVYMLYICLSIYH